jgi:TonB family protein
MIEAATDIIVARSRQTDSLQKMVVLSVVAHIAVIATVTFAPRNTTQDVPREVMTISLGGAPGPRSSGMTQMGGRQVQEVKPPEPVRRPETAPAPTRPEMTLPDPRAKRTPQTRTEKAPRDATSRTPTTGEQPSEGSARADTRIRGQGFGLSQSGGAGTGVQLDVTDFCCQEYLAEMVTLIQRNWQKDQGVVGSTVVRFTIRRDGTIEGIAVDRSSGFYALDNAASRALALTRQLPRLPAQYPNATLGVRVTFEYQR